MKFIFSIGLIVCGLLLGQRLRTIVMNKTIKESVPVSKYMNSIQRIALLGINPVVTLGAFWGIQLNDVKFAWINRRWFASKSCFSAFGYATCI